VPYAPNNILVTTLDWTMFRVPGAGNAELYLDFRYQGRQYNTAPTGRRRPGLRAVLLHPGVRAAQWTAHLEFRHAQQQRVI
jgi:hypothetical protein